MAELTEAKHKVDALEHQQEQQQQPEGEKPSEGDWMSKAEVQERLALLEAQIAAQQARSRQEAGQCLADAEARAAAAQAHAARAAQVCRPLFSHFELPCFRNRSTCAPVCTIQRGIRPWCSGAGGRSGRGGRAPAQRCRHAEQG